MIIDLKRGQELAITLYKGPAGPEVEAMYKELIHKHVNNIAIPLKINKSVGVELTILDVDSKAVYNPLLGYIIHTLVLRGKII